MSASDLWEKFDDKRTLGEALLEPTRIYVKPVLKLMESVALKGLAHITGGGLIENIPRVLPDNTCALLERSRWPSLPIFEWLQKNGRIENAEMARTFNCGIGMVLIVAKESAQGALSALAAMGVEAHHIGEIATREAGAPQAVVS